MNQLAKLLMCTTFAFAAGAAQAQSATPPPNGMNKGATINDGTMKKAPTMQECKDHMAMSKKNGNSGTNPSGPTSTDGRGMSNSDAMTQMDTTCADMMKKDGMGKAPAGKY